MHMAAPWDRGPRLPSVPPWRDDDERSQAPTRHPTPAPRQPVPSWQRPPAQHLRVPARAEPESESEPEPERVTPPPTGPEPRPVRPPTRAVCRARYAAVDDRGLGLIEDGTDAFGAMRLIVHRRSGVQLAAGDSLLLRGRPVRVQWTTRHRYYGPGRRVTTLVVGVEGAEWTGVMRELDDLASLLKHVQAIEEERVRLTKEKAAEQAENARLAKDLAEEKDKNKGLSEAKRAQMKEALDKVIMKMINESVEDAKVREEFEAGMNRLVEDTAEKNGVWQVVACASANYGRKMEELDRLTRECETLKTRGGGEFASEDSRKRRAEDPAIPGGGAPLDVWAEFGDRMKGQPSWTPDSEEPKSAFPL